MLTDIRVSSQYVLSGDTTQPSLFPDGVITVSYETDDCDKDDATQEAIVFADRDGGQNMHTGGNVILVADGHALAYAGFDEGDKTYHPRSKQKWGSTDK